MRRIVAYAPAGVTTLGLGTFAAVFGRTSGAVDFDIALCTDRPGLVTADLGLTVEVGNGLELIDTADLVLILPSADYRTVPAPEVLTALRAAHLRGITLAANCTGVFLLAAAGVLDGLEATTHWQYADEFAKAYPAVRIRPEALYLDQGSIVTGAGATAGLDLYLHLIRREHGAALANEIARGLVTPPHREGGQGQYISAPVPADGDDHRLAETITWARAHLHASLTIEQLAARAVMSPRTFARRFKAATGATPHAWLLAQRLDLAEELLETTDLPIERIAHRVGYRTAAVFREQFALRRGIPPRDYRRTFAGPSAASR
ncbi:GlxA family transcriptional regulator [Nocardia sp. NPDC056000]|uniref:GlxA family transcriptional regulator n=1 Tax=Nocardia sp. NPDC056000 TaxID=3345674 RepID=UPI0035DA15E9